MTAPGILKIARWQRLICVCASANVEKLFQSVSGTGAPLPRVAGGAAKGTPVGLGGSVGVMRGFYHSYNAHMQTVTLTDSQQVVVTATLEDAEGNTSQNFVSCTWTPTDPTMWAETSSPAQFRV